MFLEQVNYINITAFSYSLETEEEQQYLASSHVNISTDSLQGGRKYLVWVQAVNALGMEDSPPLQVHLDDIGKEWEMLHVFYYRQLICTDGVKWSKSEQSTPKVPADYKQSKFSDILPPEAILQLGILLVSFLDGSGFRNMFWEFVFQKPERLRETGNLPQKNLSPFKGRCNKTRIVLRYDEPYVVKAMAY